jgi:hypothetical protein
LGIVLLVLLSLFFGHFVACPSVPVLLAIVWPQEQGQKDKQQSDQRKGTEGQATQWPKKRNRKTSNTMVKRKGKKEQTTIYKTLHIQLKIE